MTETFDTLERARDMPFLRCVFDYVYDIRNNHIHEPPVVLFSCSSFIHALFPHIVMDINKVHSYVLRLLFQHSHGTLCLATSLFPFNGPTLVAPGARFDDISSSAIPTSEQGIIVGVAPSCMGSSSADWNQLEEAYYAADKRREEEEADALVARRANIATSIVAAQSNNSVASFPSLPRRTAAQRSSRTIALTFFANMFMNLQVLNLSQWVGSSDEDFLAMNHRSFCILHTLCFPNPTTCHAADIVADVLPDLRTVKISRLRSGNSSGSGVGAAVSLVHGALSRLKNLRALRLFACPSITAADVASIGHDMHNLRQLSLLMLRVSGGGGDRNSLYGLTASTSLTDLELRHVEPFDGTVLEDLCIALGKQLKRLCVEARSEFQFDVFLRMLGAQFGPQLECLEIDAHLTFQSFSVRQNAIANRGGASGLRVVWSVEQLRQHEQNDTVHAVAAVESSITSFCGKCHQSLKNLRLPHFSHVPVPVPFTVAATAALAQLTRLEQLALPRFALGGGHLAHLSPDHARFLAAMPHLSRLELAQTHLNDAVLLALGSVSSLHKSLRELHIQDNVQISNAGILFLRHLSSLEVLNVTGLPLLTAEIFVTLGSVSRYQHLYELDADRCDGIIWNDGTEALHLKKLPSLRVLHLSADIRLFVEAETIRNHVRPVEQWQSSVVINGVTVKGVTKRS